MDGGPANDKTAAAVQALVDEGLIAPLDRGPDVLLWHAHELALLMEVCFRERITPERVDAETWRASTERLGPLVSLPRWEALEEQIEERYFLLDDGRRAGIVALGRLALGAWRLPIHSLYVRREARRGGVASRLLEAATSAASGAGYDGIQLGTSWTWQDSLRFYVRRGLWCWNWKHQIELFRDAASPRWRFHAKLDHATFEIEERERWRLRLEARREGERLEVRERGDGELDHTAIATFSLCLGLEGWPLVRSEAHWAKRYHWSDAGDPEGLAYKIGVVEEVAREHGWWVETPRIPGLERWQAWARGEEHGRQRQAFEAIELVLRARGWSVEDADLLRLERIDAPWELQQLLSQAAKADSKDDWSRALDQAEQRCRRPSG